MVAVAKEKFSRSNLLSVQGSLDIDALNQEKSVDTFERKMVMKMMTIKPRANFLSTLNNSMTK